MIPAKGLVYISQQYTSRNYMYQPWLIVFQKQPYFLLELRQDFLVLS